MTMRWIREPVLHFLMIGAALFVLFGLARGGRSGDSESEIVVTSGRIEQLANIFAKTWQRPPTRQEIEGLVDDFVIEEIYYRQAIAMGIDRDDTIIRRRLRQKFEFLTDDAAALIKPTDEELSAYLVANDGVFRRQTTYSFHQLYINPEAHGEDVAAFAARRLAALKAGEVPGVGHGLLPPSFEGAREQQVNSTFGSGFSAALGELPLGEWSGPIESGLGFHLVRVESRLPGTVPTLAEIRPAVKREWANEKRLESRRELNASLLQIYSVVVEWPERPIE